MSATARPADLAGRRLHHGCDARPCWPSSGSAGERRTQMCVDWPSIVPGLLRRAHRGGPVRRSRDRPGQRRLSMARPSSLRWCRRLLSARRRCRCCMPRASPTAWSSSAMRFSRQLSTSSFLGEDVDARGLSAARRPAPRIVRAGIALGVVFARRRLLECPRAVVAAQARARRDWAAGASPVPLVILFSLWLAFGNLDRDLGSMPALPLALAVVFVAGGEMDRARRDAAADGRPGRFLRARRARASRCCWRCTWLSARAGRRCCSARSPLLPALATRYAHLSGARLAVRRRGRRRAVAASPSTRPSSARRASATTPVFNALLPGYGVPALAFGFAAWQLARTTDGRPRLVMEAAAALLRAARRSPCWCATP